MFYAPPVFAVPALTYGEASVFRHTLREGSPGPEMILVPPGCLTLGVLAPQPSSGTEEVGPLTCIGEFALGRHEVTFDEYDAFVQATNRQSPDDAGFGRGQRPVINVTWKDAAAYADWLAQQTGEAYRLPTETEWEYAARAGTNHAWPWGDDLGTNQAVCRRCGSEWDFRSTAPVGSFPPNPWGLHDLAGNVWEWTCSPFVARLLFWGLAHDAARPHDEGGKCAAPEASEAWVMRGGSWFTLPAQLRTTYRTGQSADYQYKTLGFRIAWSDPKVRLTRLTLKITPTDAQTVLLNPERAGNTIMDLPMGRYHLRIEKQGFVSLDQWASLTQPEQELRIVLKSLAELNAQSFDVHESDKPAPDWGQKAHLTVQTEPTNATVTLLDPERPYTPGMEVPAGHYHLLIQAHGYESVEKFVEHKPMGTNVLVSLPWIEPTTNMVLLKVPGGTFQMGSPPNEPYRNTDESPTHTVSVAPFLLGKYNVTFDQWQVCVADRGCGAYQPSEEGWGRGNRPVINVSWFDANAFAEWLSNKTGRKYRLPTEAEWEYATRAGTTSPYWWGNEMERGRGNCDGCGSQWDNRQTAPEGAFPPNQWGFSGLTGNVWEWMCSAYTNVYNGGAENRCVGKDNRMLRGLRGGSWYNLSHAMRSASRYRDLPNDRNNYTGFRLVGVL